MKSKQNKLLSPKGYISWTQLQIFEQSPEKYKQKYILGKEEDFENDFMALGKKVATALETGESTGDIATDAVLAQLVKYKHMEYEMKESFNSPSGEITLLGKLDMFEDKPSIKLREEKTGHVKWTLKRAYEHGQILQYATLIWLKYKKLPSEAWLDWIPTQRESDGEVRVTGEPVQSYQVRITLANIIDYMARVTKVAVGIDKMYREELGL